MTDRTVRLAAVLMITVTVLTGGMGIWSYTVSRAQLENTRTQFESEMTKQLGAPMAQAMWNFDETFATALLDSKLGKMVKSISARDPSGADWLVRESRADTAWTALRPLQIPLPLMDGRPVGSLEVIWSDAAFARKLHPPRLHRLGGTEQHHSLSKPWHPGPVAIHACSVRGMRASKE